MRMYVVESDKEMSIFSYIMAVILGHVEAGFPYISDTATSAPESCIFAQFVNMTATLSEYSFMKIIICHVVNL